MRIVKLPSGYKQVEYIQSTGTQYVDTGIIGKSGIKTALDFSIISGDLTDFIAMGCAPASYSPRFYPVAIQSSVWAYGFADWQNSTVGASVGARYFVETDLSAGAQNMEVNGTVIKNSTTTTSVNIGLNMFLFGANIGGSYRSYGSIKVFACQIYDNNVLARDFIPCKNSNNVAGLYDLVEGKFYGDAAGGYFISGVPLVLPKGYRRLTYIESSGTQWVNTGHNVTSQNIRIQVDMAYTGTNSDGVSFGGGAENAYSISMYGTNPKFWIGRSGSLCALTVTQGVKTSIDANANNGTLTVIQDGTTKTASYSGTISSANPVSIFAQYVGGSAIQHSTIRVYTFKIYDNSTLVRDFVPCINSVGEVGLYDDVYGVFYGNAGTGTFTVGQRVYTEDEIEKLEYIESTGTQYVDTGFKPTNENLQIVFDFEYTAAHSQSSLFGTESNSNYTIVPYGAPAFYVAKSTNILPQTTALNTRYLVDAHANNGTFTLLWNGTKSSTAYSGSLSKNLSIFLLASNKNGAATQFTLAKLYSCQIYNNGTIVRDYYPATADGIVGLWDAVSGVLYENAGSGNFVAGSVIYDGLPAPENLIAEISETGVFLRWDSVETVIGYRVYRDHLFIAESAATEYTDSDTQNWEQYTYYVRAFNEEEEGPAATVEVLLQGGNPILDLITERSNADVNRVVELSQKDFLFEMTDEERKEFLGSMKGAYNASDLNRVGAAIRYVADRLNGYGTLVKVSPKTDWTKSDVPTPKQLTDYIAEVSKVRDALEVMRSTPAVPGDMENFTYNEANNIEQILLDVDLLITNMTLAWFYCGEVYSGEV